MPIYDPASYKEDRSVRDWITSARKDELSLPTFQRSYVWRNPRIVDYLKALFERRPTGVFLILPTTDPPQFDSRPVAGGRPRPTVSNELVLDGQQRLRSLWMSLAATGDTRFYVQVKSLANQDLEVDAVVAYPHARGVGKVYREQPRSAYDANLVPVEVLGSRVCHQNERAIWKWCHEALPEDLHRARVLEDVIRCQLRDTLLGRTLEYCLLPKTIPPPVAIDIFIESNKSSATVNRFDITVAFAEQEYAEDLRDRISRFRTDNNHVRHYFESDPERFIPGIGEWYLRVACLLAGLAPKESKYQDSLRTLDVPQDLGTLENDIGKALAVAAENGAPTLRTLPSRPPILVIAALQRELREIRKPAWQAEAENLLSIYLWRSWLTDRHEVQANDRLFEDFKKLKGCLQQIAKDGTYDESEVKALDLTAHRLPESDLLANELGWIGSRNRLARATAAAVSLTAREWFTGVHLRSTKVRELEDSGQLDFHHVFPRHVLKGKFENDQINNGLNGVWLPKRTNLALSRLDPRKYLPRIVDQVGSLTRGQLKNYVESHFLPYDIMIANGDVRTRYPDFLKARAQALLPKLQELAGVPERGHGKDPHPQARTGRQTVAPPELGRRQSWVSLTDYKPPRGTRGPNSIRFQDGEVRDLGGRWNRLLVRIAERLYEDGLLLPEHLPVSKTNRRHIVNQVPRHPTGNEFDYSWKIANHVFLELGVSASDARKVSETLLSHFGLDPSQVHLRIK